GLSARLMLGRALPRVRRRYATNPLWNHYRCADDEWLALSMLQADRYWARFCEVLGITWAATDERFSSMLARMANAGDCVALLDDTFATKPRDEWLRLLAAGGVSIARIVNSGARRPTDPRARPTGQGTAFEHPAFGPVRVVGVPVRLSETPGQIRLPAPEFGQHTEEILTELLGYSWDDVTRLKEGEVI